MEHAVALAYLDLPVIILVDQRISKESERNAETPILCKIGVADVLDVIGRGEWI